MPLISTILAIFAGLAFAIQGPTNTKLSFQIGNLEAAMVSFIGGIVTLGLMVIFIGDGDFTQIINAPFWMWLGGLCGAAMVLIITYSTPLLGAAFTITIIMFGQLLMGILIDAFGWFNTNPIRIEPMRLLGCAAIMVGLLLVYTSKRISEGAASINKKISIIVILAFLAGSTGGIQAACNSNIANYIGKVEGSMLNFIVGLLITTVALIISKKGSLFKKRRKTTQNRH